MKIIKNPFECGYCDISPNYRDDHCRHPLSKCLITCKGDEFPVNCPLPNIEDQLFGPEQVTTKKENNDGDYYDFKLTKDIANKVYDILVDIGASENMRDIFVYAHITDKFQVEWRFMGLLGFGGKFWNEWSYFDEKFNWRVSCYSEDENEKREQLIKETNKKLDALASSI